MAVRRAVHPGDQAVSVVLDLVHPLRPALASVGCDRKRDMAAAWSELAKGGCLTANLGSEIEGIFQMPADVVGIGGAKNTTHFPDGAFSDAGKYPRLSP